MAHEAKGNGAEGTSSDSSVVDNIKTVCAHNARAPLTNEKQLLLFLQSWWSRTYNRPLKDPLLKSYSLEELLYEFYDRIERAKAEEENEEAEELRKEDEKDQAALDWAEQEEKRELAGMKGEAATVKSTNSADDLKNIAWMEEQMKKAKNVYGESFGEDIEESFDE